jgi:glycosyltransferase involved in cell wall biosynthesis
MQILHIDTERGWRGGERQALWLAVELQRRGHRSFVAARPGEPLALAAESAGLEVIPSAPSFETDPRVVLQLRREIIARHIDVVHAHTGHAVGLGALATVATDAPLIVARRVDFHLRRNIATRWKYTRAAAIVAISRAVAAVVESDGIDPERIVIVPDGTDVHRRIAPASQETLVALGVKSGTPLVVQVAQLVPHKDPLNFVRAIVAARARYPTLQALLVGDGPLRSEVMREVRAFDLGDALHLAGYRRDADALLAAADVAVLSSHEEGMGSVLLDALLLGKPIATTRAGGIPEVVEHDVTGLLAPVGDSEALGEHIAQLLLNPALATRLATAARARAADFSIERLTDRTLAVYERALGGESVDEFAATKRRTVSASAASSVSSTRAL